MKHIPLCDIKHCLNVSVLDAGRLFFCDMHAKQIQAHTATVAAEAAREARIDEIVNCKVAHIDMHHGDRGEFDRWCTERQKEILGDEY